MISREPYDILPSHLAWALRKADVLTGQFIRSVSPEALAELEALGLASSTGRFLNQRGMEARRWLMSGATHASRELSRVLGLVTSPSGHDQARIYEPHS